MVAKISRVGVEVSVKVPAACAVMVARDPPMVTPLWPRKENRPRLSLLATATGALRVPRARRWMNCGASLAVAVKEVSWKRAAVAERSTSTASTGAEVPKPTLA
ncbi:hypothetical protein D3C83_60680 [compost metagenome]